MSTSDQQHRPARLGVEPLEWRLLPTAMPLIAVPNSSSGFGTNATAVLGQPISGPSTPEMANSTANDEADGRDASEYGLQHSHTQDVPRPYGSLTSTPDASLPSPFHAITALDREVREREYEHREEFARTHLWGVAITPDTRQGPSGYTEQHVHVPQALREVTHNLPGSHEGPPNSAPAVSTYTPTGPAWEAIEGMREGAQVPTEHATPDPLVPSPAPTGVPTSPVVESSEVAIEPSLLRGSPVAGLLPANLVALAADAREFLNHLADLGSEWCEESGPWEYVWLSAGVLLAGGLAHAAVVARSRERIRLTAVRPVGHRPGGHNGNQDGD